MGLSLGVAALVVAVVGVGRSMSGQSGNDTNQFAMPTTQPSTVLVEGAGSGEIASWTIPFDRIASWGRVPSGEELSKQSTNLCGDLASGNSGYRGSEFERFRVKGIRYEVSVSGPNGVEQMTLVCSTNNVAVNQLTIGPGPDGASVACPEDKPKVRERTGAVYFRGTGRFGDPNKLSSLPAPDRFDRHKGSYGSGNDGLWNYWYYNPSLDTPAVPVLWLVCQ